MTSTAGVDTPSNRSLDFASLHLQDLRKRRRDASNEGNPRPAITSNNPFHRIAVSQERPSALPSRITGFVNTHPKVHTISNLRSGPRDAGYGVQTLESIKKHNLQLTATSSHTSVRARQALRTSQRALPRVTHKNSSLSNYRVAPSSDSGTTRDAKQSQPPPIKESGVMKYTILEDRTGPSSTQMSILLCALKQNDSLLDLAKAIVGGQKELGEITTVSATPQLLPKLFGSKIYGCLNCTTHFALHENIISRQFRGQHGKAYLFSEVVNVSFGEPSERNMTTGRHLVRDISCKKCEETVGWRFDKAYEKTEKYKEGKTILEAELVCIVT